MNVKLKAISDEVCLDLAAFIKEKEEEILEAWDAAEQEAQDQETKPKFKLGYAITLDLDKDQMETALSWSVRHKVSRDRQIPDPSQPGLKGLESVTISSGTTSVTLDANAAKKLRKAADKLSHG